MNRRDTDLAVIGLAFTLPDADTKAGLVRNLRAGRCSVRYPNTLRETDARDHWARLHPDGSAPPLFRGCFLDDIAGFAPEHFHLTPAEAECMSPHQRLALLTARRAFWDAGYPEASPARRRTGVFVGGMGDIGTGQYREAVALARPELVSVALPGNLASIIAGRISYAFDLAGPATLVDTACSSSLYALHLARESVLRDECDMALVGGVRLLALAYHTGEKLGMESADGYTRTFDHASAGTGYGEGAAFVLLKRASAALADGDHVYALLTGTAANQDAAAEGITTPNPEAQTEVLLAAWEQAGIDPGTLGYYEAHGTGTRVGDRYEVRALSRAFARHTPRRQFCAIGSVKSNIGHLFEAAGVAGVVKACLALERRRLFPTANFDRPNALIEFERSPVFVSAADAAWPAADHPRRAAVSAFGFSGTNVHAVLEEAPPRADRAASTAAPVPVVLSAADERGLSAYADALVADWPEGAALADIAHTLAARPRSALTVWCEPTDTAGLVDLLGCCPGPGWRTDAPPVVPTGRTVPLAAPPLALSRHWIAPASVPRVPDLLRVFAYEAIDRPAGEGFAAAARLDLRGLATADDVDALLARLGDLLAADATEPLLVLTRPAHSVTGAEDLSPLAAAAQAMALTVARERGASAICVLDTDADAEPPAAVLARCTPGLAINRGGEFFERRLVPAPDPVPGVRPRRPGAYICTGGTGAIGLAVAEYLAGDPDATIVLVNRSGRLGATERARLERWGATVEVAACDVTDAMAVRACVDDVRRRHGGIRGVSHAAGVAGGGFVAGREASGFRAVIDPKALGAEHLAEATETDDLEFFLLHSSLLATFLLPGQCDYAMANAYVDAFAARRNRAGRFTPVIRWPQWRGGGMAARGGLAADSVFRALEPADGVRIVADVLRHRRESVLVGELTDDPGLLRLLRDFGVPFDAETEGWLAGRIDATDAPAGDGVIVTKLTELARSAFGLRRVDVHQSFFDMGADSIMLTRLRDLVNEQFGVALNVADFFGCPTIAKLGDRLADLAGDARTPAPSRAAAAAPTTAADEPIAVVGMAVQLPGIDTLDGFWELLTAGGTTIRPPAAGRRSDLDRYFARIGQRGYRHLDAGYLDGIDLFDADFFGIGEREATLMDPHQRLFLTTSWRALADAGYTRDALRGAAVGVYAGYAANLKGDYLDLVGTFEPENLPLAVPGNLPAILPSRLSYAFDMTGPSLVVDAACASSLVAVDLACQALRRGDCAAAVAGGVRLHLCHRDVDPGLGIESVGGVTRPFDADADGTVLGEGAGAVVLKPLGAALAAGDRIYGVIRGTAVNQDGHSTGITAPNPAAQARLLRTAWRAAGVTASALGCIETHGTGTPLGDPIEYQALREAFADDGGPADCCLGAVKANVGHLFEAAGIASLIKMMLQLQHRTVAPLAGFRHPNPALDLHDSPLRLPLAATPWPHAAGEPLVGGVSAFGLSGTNCHVVVAEAPTHAARMSPVDPGLNPRRHWVTPPAICETFLRRELVPAAAGEDAPRPDRVLTDASGFARGWAAVADATGPTEAWPGAGAAPGEAVLVLLGAATLAAAHGRPALDAVTALVADSAPGSRLDLVAEDDGSGFAALVAGLVLGLAKDRPDLDLRVACAGRDADAAATLAPFRAATGASFEISAAGVRTRQLEEFDVVADAGLPGLLRAGGHYLVTGGAGGIGLAVAEHLAALAPVHLHLVGRRPLAEDGTSAAETRLAAACAAIRAAGSTVTYHRADVASRGQLAAVLDAIGVIDGVVHAAGCAETPDADPAAVLAPKVQGLRILDGLLAAQDRAPDFVVCFSSVATTLPAPGQAVYAAANSYVEAFVQERRRAGLNYVDVQWVIWRDTGMAHDLGRGVDTAFSALATRDALRKLEAVMATGSSGLIAGDLNPDPALAGLLAAGDVPLGPRLAARLERPATAGAVATPSMADARAALMGIVASVAGAPADPGASFADLGLDSVALAHLFRRVDEAFPGRLCVADLFSYPTIDALAAKLVGGAPDAPAVSVAPVAAGTAADVDDTGLAIAVVGMGCRLPIGESPDEFFASVMAGAEALGPFPPSRAADLSGYLSATGRDGLRFSDGSFLADIADFDHDFFGIPPAQAATMDPHQRIMLQVAQDAFADAGCGADHLRGSRCGVYLGYAAPTVDSYADIVRTLAPQAGGAAVPGNLSAILAGRIAFAFDLRGPALVIDTACSSALSGVLLACRALRAGECDLALAGGIKLHLVPARGGLHLGIESGDGRTRPFAATASGTGIGEAAGAVVLKPLDAARRDGDAVYAVIRGGAMNSDGLTNGITAPSAHRQAEVIAEALATARVAPGDIRFVEAHGTGTVLGDPVEFAGLAEAFGDTGHCAIGSVKANVGHTFEAAGIVSLIHAVNCLRHRRLPRLLHFEEPNPALRLEGSPFYFPTEPESLEGDAPLRCGVSAFGFSGTNVHLVLEGGPTHTEPR